MLHTIGTKAQGEELVDLLLACHGRIRMFTELAIAHRLRTELEPHLDAEERIVFPAVRALLTHDERQAIVGELRTRRRPP